MNREQVASELVDIAKMLVAGCERDRQAVALSRGARHLLDQLQTNPDSILNLKTATGLGSRRWDDANVLGKLGLVEWAPRGEGLQLTRKGKTAGCEKLPAGAMRDNCNKKTKGKGKDDKSDDKSDDKKDGKKDKKDNLPPWLKNKKK